MNKHEHNLFLSQHYETQSLLYALVAVSCFDHQHEVGGWMFVVAAVLAASSMAMRMWLANRYKASGE